MAGFDYKPGPKLTASLRVGGEYTRRDGLSDETTPYVEFAAKYDYAQGVVHQRGLHVRPRGDIQPGAVLRREDEPDVREPPARLHRLRRRLGVRAVRARRRSSAGPGRRTSRRTRPTPGLALTYLPNKNWTVTASYDYDFVDSGISSRGMNRSRDRPERHRDRSDTVGLSRPHRGDSKSTHGIVFRLQGERIPCRPFQGP